MDPLARRIHRVPISHEAVALIRLRRDIVPKGCPFLFPGDVPDQPVGDPKRFWPKMQKVFSTRSRRFIMSVVIGGNSGPGWCQQPDPTGTSQETTSPRTCTTLTNSIHPQRPPCRHRPFQLHEPLETWPSGRRHTPAKGADVKSVSRVRIPSSPPLAPAKAFSRSGCGRIFLLLSRVMRDGLSTAPADRWPGSGLSGSIFSGPVACVISVKSLQAPDKKTFCQVSR